MQTARGEGGRRAAGAGACAALPAPLMPCGICRQHNAADPLPSQGLKYSGFPTTVVSLGHGLASPLLPCWVSPSGFRAQCLLKSNKLQLVVWRCRGAMGELSQCRGCCLGFKSSCPHVGSWDCGGHRVPGAGSLGAGGAVGVRGKLQRQL